MKEFKEGQKAFSVHRGNTTITNIVNGVNFPVKTDGGIYTREGKIYADWKHPALFHSLQDCVDYFSSLLPEKNEEVIEVWMSPEDIEKYKLGGQWFSVGQKDDGGIKAKLIIEKPKRKKEFSEDEILKIIELSEKKNKHELVEQLFK